MLLFQVNVSRPIFLFVYFVYFVFFVVKNFLRRAKTPANQQGGGLSTFERFLKASAVAD